MAECRAGEFPDQYIIEGDQTYQSEYQDFVKLLSGTQGTAHESNTEVLEIYEYGEPIRDLKGGGGGGGGGGACSLHAEFGSCPFPALPRPLNFASGNTCRCQCQCPCTPVECPPLKCPPKPVECCLPGIHKQYRDFYPDCKESHLPSGYRNCVEHDDLYLPCSRPLSPNSDCNMPMSSRSCSPPPTRPPPRQRCHCGAAQYQCSRLQPDPTWNMLIAEPKPGLQTCFQKVEPCFTQPSPKHLICPAQVDPCPQPSLKYLASPDQVDPCRPPPPPKCLSFPDRVNSCCFPISPKRLPLPDQINPCCFPISPKRLHSTNRADPCSPPSPKRVALPTRADTCCFPISPKRLTLPAKVDPLSFPKRVIRLALPARVNPCCYPPSPKRFALPARVSGGMGAEYNTIPEPAVDESEKCCVDYDQKPSSNSLWSQKPVQRIYVCLPYPANPLPTSPNCLSSLLKPLPSNDEKNPPDFIIRSELNEIPISSPPPPLQSRCQECISQRPTPRSPNCTESLSFVEAPLPKSPQSRSISPMQPNIKSSLISRISEVRHLMSSSCQYSPRIDTERPKVFLSQKSGPSPPTSPCHPDPSPPCPPQKRPSPYRPPRPTVYHPPEPVGLPEPSHTKSPSPRPLNQSALVAKLGTVEKHVQCNCSPRVVSLLHDSANLEQSYSKRPVSPSLYEAISRILRPESPRPIFRSLLPEIPSLAPSPRRLECTCQKPEKRNNNQFCNASQIGSRSQSPSQSSNSTAQYRRVENVNITNFLDDVKRILKKDFPSRMRQADQKQDLKRDFYSSVRSALKTEFPFKDFSSSVRTDQNQEFPSSGRTTDQNQEFSSTECLSIVRSTLKPEFPSSSRGRTTDRKQNKKQEFSPRTYSKQEFLSSLRPTERKQEYVSCVRMTERGTSPNIGKPVMVNSGTNGPGMESDDRPKTASIITSTNSEAPSKPKPLQSEDDHIDAMRKPSTRTPQEDNPPEESDEDYRYGPMEAIPEAANSKQIPSKRNFNKRDTTSRAAPNREVIRRCCCGMCKSTHSRSHLSTKCSYCANVHSCCCGMCSCPFPNCTSKSPIPDSESSMSTNGKLALCNPNNPGYSRPKSLSPLARRSYVAGPREIPNKHGPRSKSSRPKCKSKQKERQPSPRALLKSFNSYLNSQCRPSKIGLAPHMRRCSHDHRRPPHWHSPHVSPARNCSQPAKRSMIRQSPSWLQQAPWGTHPILLSSRPSNSRLCMDQIPQPRLLSSGPHRGCCCPRCANGKL